jgi:hypothetical protein
MRNASYLHSPVVFSWEVDCALDYVGCSTSQSNSCVEPCMVLTYAHDLIKSRLRKIWSMVMGTSLVLVTSSCSSQVLFLLGNWKTQLDSEAHCSRVEWLVSEHLSAQGNPDPSGGLHYFFFLKKSWTPPLGASDALNIVQNGLEMRKLWPPK